MAEENRQKLENELESAKRALRDCLDFTNDDSNLTEEGIAAREALLEDIEAIEQDTAAIKQEHELD